MRPAKREDVRRVDFAFPLVIIGNELCCPYETHSRDKLVLTYPLYDSHTVNIAVTPEDMAVPTRNFLYSRLGNRKIMTMSGYISEGLVDVYSWKKRLYPDHIKDNEREGIEIVDQVELILVTGHDNATRFHTNRIAGLELDDISLEEAEKVYVALTNYVPNYPSGKKASNHRN